MDAVGYVAAAIGISYIAFCVAMAVVRWWRNWEGFQ